MPFPPQGFPTGGPDEGWQLITTYTQTNPAVAFTFDSGVLTTTYDMYKIFGQVINNGVGIVAIACRVNGIVGGYIYVYYSTVGITQSVGQPYWQLAAVNVNADFPFDYIIRGSFGDAIAREPRIFGNGATNNNPATLLQGYNTGGLVNINRIEVLTILGGALGTGRIQLFGKNF